MESLTLTDFPLVFADELQDIRYTSPKVAEPLGYTPDALRGKSVQVLMPERYRTLHTTAVNDLLIGKPHGNLGHPLDLEALCADGTELPIRVWLSVLTYSQGRFFVAWIEPRVVL